MLTLHTAREATRNAIKWVSISIAGILLCVILIRSGIAIKEFFFPTPPPPPTVGFGTLPHPVFGRNATDKTLNYSVNTVRGTLPNFPDKVSVYKLVQPKANLLSPKRAADRVKNIGFSESGTQLSESLYQWIDPLPSNRTILLDTLTSNFSLSSNFISDETILSSSLLPDEKTAKEVTLSFLSSLELLPYDIDDKKAKTSLLTIQNGQLIPATSLSKTQVIRVDLFQKDIDELPIYYPHPPYSTMNFLVAPGQQSYKQVIRADFYHYSISEVKETYPVKTSKQAFKELQEGNAYIASLEKDSNTVNIKDVFLGYYLGDLQQEFLMPIIIFQGDNNFFAYVSAVTDEWIEK